jgi:hypothetical protein
MSSAFTDIRLYRYTGKGAFGESAIVDSGSRRRLAYTDCLTATLVGTIIGLGIFVF